MSLHTITAEQAVAMMAVDDALLVDVRETDERARLHVPGSAHLPLSRLAGATLDVPAGRPVLFHCVSGARTAGAAPALAALARENEAYLVAGGLEALRRAGARVAEDRRAPIPLMRQVQIAAGGLALGGTVLGATVHPGFHAISAFVGAELVMAGLTGACPMARALAAMPWNRLAA